ncbi:MAG TPA: ABC transporter permease [Ilumatobacteraceae bacterium]|nr:ABC transporter permease [Ilumatobacteraceae bacterium]
MRQTFREFKRAPARIIVSILALALALGAIGVFAIPAVASSSLRNTVGTDRMANLVLDTTDTGASDVVAVAESVAGVDDALAQVVVDVGTGPDDPGTSLLTVIGRDLADERVDRVSATTGRLPIRTGEVVVTAGVAAVGDLIAVTDPDGHEVDLIVVGVGGTSYFAGESVAFTTLDTATDLAGIVGYNRVAVRASDTSADSLRSTADALRERLAAEGITLTTLPLTVPDGTHPIEAAIEQVSMLIGFLGIVAGLVALVLLGSTTNTLITERTREAAVMRALGARNRPLRRRLRRIAVAIAAAAVVIGLPLGIVISNVIARMVMQEFLDITPGYAVSVPVLLASAAFALVGAALVASRAARKVTRIPLANALRDRDGSPFGRRWAERMVARGGLGGLLERAALRNAVHRRSRSIAIIAQVTAAVAALLVIASLATTVNAYNASEYEPWSWNTRTTVSGTGLDIDTGTVTSLVADDPTAEPAIETIGEVDGWEVDLFGLQPDTDMLDRTVDHGTWITGGNDVVVSTGFAERSGIAVGDDIDVRIATGTVSYHVVGMHPLSGRTLVLDVDTLAADLGQPGSANVVLSASSARNVTLAGGLATTTSFDDYASDDGGRSAILLIFGAIGLVVVAVAGLAVASSLAVNVYERRHEFAAIRAIGGRSRAVLRVVSAELLPLAALGVVAGVSLGYLGARAIMDSFERADAVEIGFAFAGGAVPAVALTVVVGCLLIGALTVRRVSRQSVAATLRSAS